MIGICGRAGSGKTTCGMILEKALGYRRVSFARPLKRIVAEMFTIDSETITDETME